MQNILMAWVEVAAYVAAWSISRKQLLSPRMTKIATHTSEGRGKEEGQNESCV